MKIEPCELPEVHLLTPEIYRDDRGILIERYRTEVLAKVSGRPIEFVQANLSVSVPWAIRGLHYQIGDSPGKLVNCVKGAIFDVAVDVRRSSPTFGRWCGRVLDDVAHEALWVPPGFAHGFMAFGHGATVVYECTSCHDASRTRVIRWDSPDIDIRWPIDPSERPVLSHASRMPVLRHAEVLP